MLLYVTREYIGSGCRRVVRTNPTYSIGLVCYREPNSIRVRFLKKFYINTPYTRALGCRCTNQNIIQKPVLRNRNNTTILYGPTYTEIARRFSKNASKAIDRKSRVNKVFFPFVGRTVRRKPNTKLIFVGRSDDNLQAAYNFGHVIVDIQGFRRTITAIENIPGPLLIVRFLFS